jgi:hypothetical protein
MDMQISKTVFVFLLITGACASTPGDRGSREAAKKPIRGGVVELHVTSFDTRDLEGRILIGATVDPLVIDRRMIPWTRVELKNTRSCDTKAPLIYWVFESFVEPPKPEDVITVPRGYWWGADVLFQLFDKRQTTEPDCFEADLVVHDNKGRLAARQPIHVVRTDKPPAPTDSGTEAPKPPALDAGAP